MGPPPPPPPPLALSVFRLHDEGNAVDIVRLLDDPGGADASKEDVGGVAQVVILLDLVDLVEVPGIMATRKGATCGELKEGKREEGERGGQVIARWGGGEDGY